MGYIIKSICNKFDIDYLLELPISYKEIIRKEVEKHPKTWISTFIYDILTLSYDEMKPILYDFNSTSDNLTDDIISNPSEWYVSVIGMSVPGVNIPIINIKPY